ncbi:MAG: hypothetical protein IKZ85_04905 [Pseudobutyrivibrio sp.]|nr:hypothetical protein [Pseudobutyrivibrio sp.]
MRKISSVLIIIFTMFMLTGCTEQAITKEFGGDMTINLEPGQKLEEITWKDDNLWYVTRPMRDDEFAETHIFQESSEFGLIEGTVYIVESEEW